MTPEIVLAEFEFWLDEQPDCRAKRWIEEHPPQQVDVVRVLSHA